MRTMLVGRLSGQNEIVETHDDSEKNPGIRKLGDFLKEVGMDNHPACLELSQVLKVNHEKFIECAENGFVDHSSRQNIADYVYNFRLCGKQLHFLQSQSGSEGTKNVPDEYNHLNYQPSVLSGGN